MIEEITQAAGIPSRGSHFAKPPAGVYCVWFDDITTDGADGRPPSVFTHAVILELYEPKPAPDAVADLEAAMSERDLHWTKQDRLWIVSEQRYQTIYEFTYTEKRRA